MIEHGNPRGEEDDDRQRRDGKAVAAHRRGGKAAKDELRACLAVAEQRGHASRQPADQRAPGGDIQDEPGDGGLPGERGTDDAQPDGPPVSGEQRGHPEDDNDANNAGEILAHVEVAPGPDRERSAFGERPFL